MKTYADLLALIQQRGVHPVFGDAGEGYGIEQNPHELATFLVHMQQLGVSSVLEIGTGHKAGLARFLHDDMGWSVTSVDIRDYGHTFEGIEFVTGLGSVAGRFDLVFIDGDHAYESAQRDHELWGIHATKVIAFHDIDGQRACEGVEDYWACVAWQDTGDDWQLKAGCYEIITEDAMRAGIGYIVLGEAE